MFACFGLKSSKKQKSSSKSSKMSTPQAIRRFLVNQLHSASSEESLNSSGFESADFEFNFGKEIEERSEKKEFLEVMQRAKRASLQRKLSQRSIKSHQNTR